jgi:hypothetical protein
MPVTDAFRAEVSTRGHGENPYPELTRLSADLAALAREWSRRVPVAYVETDYLGGLGSQAAMAWVCGEVAFGPLRTGTWDKGPRAINGALQVLGVNRLGDLDKFDTIGLGEYRRTDLWAAQGGR